MNDLLRSTFTASHRLFLMILAFSACEWKPPRRPIQVSQTSDQLNLIHDATLVGHNHPDQQVDQQVFDLGSVKKITQPTPKNDPSLTKISANLRQRSNLNETAEINAEQTKNQRTEQDSLSTAKQSEVPIPVEKNDLNQNTALSLEERIKQRDYLLTIDPDGPPLIHLKELTVAKSVQRREPEGVSKVYDVDTKQVITFLRVRNFENTQKIQLKWMYEGEVIQLDRLQVGISPRWRTWSSIRFNQQEKRYGEWRIEVTTGQGQLLGLTHFVRKTK
jgi:hypothetical protein